MYILTEDEFAALKAEQPLPPNPSTLSTKELQELCTHIAMTMPVAVAWCEGEQAPWGCRLSKAYDDSEWPCDDCPVQKICPAPKIWNK